jgi:hypothetical protein
MNTLKYPVIGLSVLLLIASCTNEDYVSGDDSETWKSSKLIPFVAGSQKGIDKVYEYKPAPGQFVNDGYSATTMDEAINFAETQLFENESYVTLGGFGGFLVSGFDHSVMNIQGNDFMIMGNPFVGPNGCSCEPGIVMVMQDENGNGKPDDTWYELKGGNHDDASTIRNYSITYQRPTDGPGDVIWTDNQGGSGQVSYIPAFHAQMYYPEWISQDTYTLTGTLLAHRTIQDPVTGFWSNEPFAEGYADNLPAEKNASGSYDLVFDNEGNKFDIDNAINSNGKSMELTHIDFVKVYTALNIEAGWLGENSTEVFGIEDINPEY